MKVKIKLVVERTLDIDPEDYRDDHEELWDEEDNLDEDGLLDQIKDDYETDDELLSEFVVDASVDAVTITVKKAP